MQPASEDRVSPALMHVKCNEYVWVPDGDRLNPCESNLIVGKTAQWLSLTRGRSEYSRREYAETLSNRLERR